MSFLQKLFGKKKENDTMANVKLAVIFYSMGGTNYQLAQWAKEGAEEAGAEVKIVKSRRVSTRISHSRK